MTTVKEKYIQIIDRLIQLTESNKIEWKTKNPKLYTYDRVNKGMINKTMSLQMVQTGPKLHSFVLRIVDRIKRVEELNLTSSTNNQDIIKQSLNTLFISISTSIESKKIELLDKLLDELE